MAKALNDLDVSNYHKDGYVLVKGLLDSQEVGSLARAARGRAGTAAAAQRAAAGLRRALRRLPRSSLAWERPVLPVRAALAVRGWQHG